jgi:hypothetical protein
MGRGDALELDFAADSTAARFLRSNGLERGRGRIGGIVGGATAERLRVTAAEDLHQRLLEDRVSVGLRSDRPEARGQRIRRGGYGPEGRLRGGEATGQRIPRRHGGGT